MEFGKLNLTIYCVTCVLVSWGFVFGYLSLTNQFPPLQYNDLWINDIVIMALVGLAIGMIIPPFLFRQHDTLTWLYHVGIMSATLILVYSALHVLFVSLLIAALT